MSVWTFLTTGAVAGVAGWGGNWLKDWLNAGKQRRDSIEGQIRDHVAKFAPKYDLMSNHAYLMAGSIVGYLNSKMAVQLTANTASGTASLDRSAGDAARDSLFYAAKFYRTLSELFWVEGAKYYLPDAWAGQTMQDLHNQIMARLSFRLERLTPFLDDKTLVGDFAVQVENARSKDDDASRGLLEEVKTYRTWLINNDHGARELASYAVAYAALFEQQMASAWAKPSLFPRRKADTPLAPDLDDAQFTQMAGTTGLIRAAERERAKTRKAWTDLLDRQRFPFYRHLGRGWYAYTNDDFEGALEEYRHAMTAQPGSAHVHNNMANVLAKQGKYADAAERYQQALAGSDLDERTRAIFELNFAMMWSARAAADGQSADERRLARENALAHSRAATRHSPSDAFIWNELGNRLSEMEQWSEARDAYRTAIEMAPDAGVIHANWADACEQQGSAADGGQATLKEAIQHYKDAIANTAPGEAGKELDKGAYCERIARLLERLKCPNDAMIYRRMAMEADAGNALYLYRLVAVYDALKQTMPDDEFARLSQTFAPSRKAEDRFWVGRARFLRNDFLGALDDLDKAVRANPGNAEYQYQLGRALYALRLHDKAVSCYRKAFDLDPGQLSYCRSLGLALQAAGLYDDAVAPLKTILDRAPNHYDMDCMLALAEASAYGKDKDTAAALAICDHCIAADAKDYRPYQCVGRIQATAGHYTESLSAFAKAFSACLDARDRQTLLQMRREACDLALKQDGANRNFLIESGEVYSRMARYADASAAFDAAAALGPMDADTEKRLTKLRGDVSYQLAMQQDKGSSARNAHCKDAIEQWQTALKLETDPNERAKLLNNIGTVYDDLGRAEEAGKNYLQSAQLAPGAKVARYNFAQTLYRMGAFTRALAEFEDSYRLGLTTAQPLYQIGNCNYRLNRIDLAKPNWEEACRLDPEYPEPLSNLGVCDLLEGREQDAVNKWKQALRMNPRLEPTAGFMRAIENKETLQLSICEARDETPPPPAQPAAPPAP